MNYTKIIKRTFQMLGGSNVPNTQSTHWAYAQDTLPDIIKSVLEEYPWAFARKLANLTPNPTDGTYTLPTDYTTLAWISCPRYTIFGDQIHTNETSCTIIYTSDDCTADEANIQTPIYFEDLVTYKMCQYLAPYMTGEPERGLIWIQAYDKAFDKATVLEMDTQKTAEQNIDPYDRFSGTDSPYQY